MLSLTPRFDSSLPIGVQDAKPRLTPTEYGKKSTDFTSYLNAALESTSTLAPPQPPVEKIETKTETPPQTNETRATDSKESAANSTTAQKAGESESTTHEKAASKDEHSAEKNKAKGVRVEMLAVGDRELLQALGLLKMKENKSKAIPAEGSLSSAFKTLRLQEKLVSTNPKAQSLTKTLTLLEKSPDALLMANAGLKKLTDKLGNSLIEKVMEKLSEQKNKARGGLSEDAPLKITTEARAPKQSAQKAGIPSEDTLANSRENAKTKGASHRAAASGKESTTQAQDSLVSSTKIEAKPLQQNQQTSTTARDLSHIAFKLTEAQSTPQNTPATRFTVENPTVRADLMRQFESVIQRAHVLVTDTQNAHFSVKLFPREMGRVQIDLKLVDGEIRGKIVVESDDVKHEMQNFLNDQNKSSGDKGALLQAINIEVRNSNENAQSSTQRRDNEALLENLVTRNAASTYDQSVTAPSKPSGALYA